MSDDRFVWDSAKFRNFTVSSSSSNVIKVEKEVRGCWLLCLSTDRVPNDAAREAEKLLKRFEARTWLMEVDATEPYRFHVWFIVDEWKDVKEVSEYASKSRTWTLSKIVYKNLEPEKEGQEVKD